jgi:aspartyl aminopeptidase
MESSKFEKFNIQTYGGGLWQTWFDRDLSVAGKVVVKDPETKKLSSKLVRIDYPIMRIPHLAIHLSSDRGKFEWNNENHLKAILSTTFFDEKSKNDDSKDLPEQTKIIHKKLGKKLSTLISSTMNVDLQNIIDFDLCLYDTQNSCLLGIDQEFVSSGRLDNLGSSLVSLHAMINSCNEIENQSGLNFIALFDNEEVGSLSFQGADSEFFGNNLFRIFTTIEKTDENEKSNDDSFLAACARSFVLSADMAHAFHPNYPEKYQSDHKPMIHSGVTIKINPQSRYATDSEGAALLKEIAKKADVPVQEFIVRQDSPCGTTIGPIISGKLGIKTADVGVPQLAMHSIREMCGVVDLYHYRRFFEEFLKSYEEIRG